MLQQEDRIRQDASGTKDVVSDAVRKLRIAFGETQQRFAERLGTALITVTRWETSRPPTTDSALEQLEKLAREKGLEECAEVFKTARTDRSRTARLRSIAAAPLILQNEQETSWCSALLRAMRSPQQYAPELETIESALSRPLADIEEVISNAQAAGDVVKAIAGLAAQGKTQEEIADLFDLDPNDVGQILLIEHLKPYKSDAPDLGREVREPDELPGPDFDVVSAYPWFRALIEENRSLLPKTRNADDIRDEADERFLEIVPKLLEGQAFEIIAERLGVPIESVRLIARVLGLESGKPGTLALFTQKARSLEAKFGEVTAKSREARKRRLAKSK